MSSFEVAEFESDEGAMLVVAWASNPERIFFFVVQPFMLRIRQKLVVVDQFGHWSGGLLRLPLGVT